jgi:hypothetical protein
MTKLRSSEDADVHCRGQRVALKKELIDERIDWDVKIYRPGMDPVTQTRQQRRHEVILTSGSGNDSSITAITPPIKAHFLQSAHQKQSSHGVPHTQPPHPIHF